MFTISRLDCIYSVVVVVVVLLLFVLFYETVSSFSKTLPRDEIVEKARYYLKNPEKWDEYSLVFNNCEHFATFCATGEKSSVQVQKTVAAVVIGATLAVATGVAMYLSKDTEKEDKKIKKDKEDKD